MSIANPSHAEAQWALEQWERGSTVEEIRDALGWGWLFSKDAEDLIASAIDLNAGHALLYRPKLLLRRPNPILSQLLRKQS